MTRRKISPQRKKKGAKNRQSTLQRKAMEKKSRRGKRKKICRILIYCSKTISKVANIIVFVQLKIRKEEEGLL
jgi:hypothetical protein